MVANGRKAPQFGENGCPAKLTEDQAKQIYELAWAGLHSQAEIGEMFGVSRSKVTLIKLRKNWKHLWQRPRWSTPTLTEIPFNKETYYG
jgi:transposase